MNRSFSWGWCICLTLFFVRLDYESLHISSVDVQIVTNLQNEVKDLNKEIQKSKDSEQVMLNDLSMLGDEKQSLESKIAELNDEIKQMKKKEIDLEDEILIKTSNKMI